MLNGDMSATEVSPERLNHVSSGTDILREDIVEGVSTGITSVCCGFRLDETLRVGGGVCICVDGVIAKSLDTGNFEGSSR